MQSQPPSSIVPRQRLFRSLDTMGDVKRSSSSSLPSPSPSQPSRHQQQQQGIRKQTSVPGYWLEWITGSRKDQVDNHRQQQQQQQQQTRAMQLSDASSVVQHQDDSRVSSSSSSFAPPEWLIAPAGMDYRLLVLALNTINLFSSLVALQVDTGVQLFAIFILATVLPVLYLVFFTRFVTESHACSYEGFSIPHRLPSLWLVFSTLPIAGCIAVCTSISDSASASWIGLFIGSLIAILPTWTIWLWQQYVHVNPLG